MEDIYCQGSFHPDLPTQNKVGSVFLKHLSSQGLSVGQNQNFLLFFFINLPIESFYRTKRLRYPSFLLLFSLSLFVPEGVGFALIHVRATSEIAERIELPVPSFFWQYEDSPRSQSDPRTHSGSKTGSARHPGPALKIARTERAPSSQHRLVTPPSSSFAALSKRPRCGEETCACPWSAAARGLEPALLWVCVQVS